MVYIYMDESGDMGMKCRESGYFIITAVRINDERSNILFRRIPKKVRQRVLKKKLKALPELKFSNTPERIREIYLKLASGIDIEIYAIALDKSKANRMQRNDVIYRRLSRALLDKALCGIKTNAELVITLDKCMTLRQREDLKSRLKQELEHIFSKAAKAAISHEDSKNNAALQVADFICGAFGYKYNTPKHRNDPEKYIALIYKRIKSEEIIRI